MQLGKAPFREAHANIVTRIEITSLLDADTLQFEVYWLKNGVEQCTEVVTHGEWCVMFEESAEWKKQSS